ncbi:MAG: amino acid ABC transporter permease [Coriobacteriaceae bacterium]|nr:amino acid ABC transporter permease [Coriobacteriaceae bacterium]
MGTASPRALNSRWPAVAVVLLAMALFVVPAIAAAAPGDALVGVEITLNNTSGGSLTRFTFVAKSAAPIDSLDLAFPRGFDLSKITLDVVTLEGLTRVPVTAKHEVDGTALKMTFSPPIGSGATIRAQIRDVRLPATGGEHEVGVTYVSQGTAGSVASPEFTFETVKTSELLSRWLDEQPWVKSWNTVDALRLFAQPQKIAIAVPLLFVGWLTSITLVAIAFPFAIVGGLALAFARMSKIPPVRWFAGLYINVIRGTPLFLQIYIAFVGLPIAGVRAPLFITGVLVLALNSSAYLAEIFRAGIQSIHKGQFEAASSVGMTYWQAMQHVIVPQTVKRVLPTMTSEFILLFKDTALLSAVGVFELMLYSNSIATRSGNLTPFVVAAVYYLIITIPLINWVGRLEAKLAVAEGGQTPQNPNKRGGLFWRPASAGPIAEYEASAEVHESR